MDSAPDGQAPWLLLVHQLPAEPSRTRVKTWRRLQSVGAVAVKNSVWILPNSSEAREDFEWIRTEIIATGGEAMVFAAHAVDELAAGEIRDALASARRSEWEELARRCDEILAAEAPAALRDDAPAGRLRRQVRALRSRAARIDRVDQVRGAGRQEALAALDRVERLAEPGNPEPAGGAARRRVEEYRERVWFTRPRPGVDRMASAWLIRRFIDPRATFRFGERIPPESDVVPFDMFGVELGHHGERVTFETLLHEFGLDDAALARLARIVRELDLRAESFSDDEAPTVGHLVAGLRASVADDVALLAHGMALFEALYASFSSQATGG